MAIFQSRSLAFIAAMALLLGMAYSWRVLSTRDGRTDSATRPAYVGDQSCRDCHGAIYDQYQRNPMHWTWHPLTTENAIENFAQDNHVYDSKRDLHYEMVLRDGLYSQREYRTDAAGAIT